MDKALDIVNQNKLYKKIFKEVSNKYKKYGKFSGRFTLIPKNNEEANILFNFDENVFINNKALVNVNKLVALFESVLKNHTFKELVEFVLNEDLITKKEAKEIEVNDRINFFKSFNNNWINYTLENKTYGYNLLISKYNKLEKEINYLDNHKKLYKSSLDDMQKSIENVIVALNNAPYKNNTFENLAIFSAKITKNPHFFDTNSFGGSLLINAICYDLKREIPKNVLELNKMYYDFGILRDEISNNTTIFKLKGYKCDKEVNSLKEYFLWNEPLQISISNLQKIDYLECVDNKVFIFENPSVFNYVKSNIKKDVSFICTSGQLNLASYLLIDKIKNLEKIYYAGDFDPEGILIALRLKEIYKDKFKFMLYDKKYYDAIKDENILINKKRLNKLKNIKNNDIDQLINEVLKYRNPGYQELLINRYVEFIEKVVE